jgi:guanylate kinase
LYRVVGKDYSGYLEILVFRRKIFADQAIGIFIKYDSLDLLKDRIKANRPDITKEDLETRYKQAFTDMSYEKFYNYSVVNPEGHPEQAIEEVERIIAKELDEKN